MALFSRRPKQKPDQGEADDVVAEPTPGDVEEVAAESTPRDTADAAGESTPGDDADSSRDDAAESATSVGISVSSYGGFGAAAPPAAAGAAETPDAGTATATAATASARPRGADPATATAPRQTETIPGLRDNALLRETLARLTSKPAQGDLLNVARQMLQGHLFLRVKGDARTQLSEGNQLSLTGAKIGDRTFAVAYSSGAALGASIRADGDVDTSAMGQPTIAVLRHVVNEDAAGLIIDPASAPARAIVPRELIDRILSAIDEELTVKTLLAQERTEATAGHLAEALTRVPVWVAVNRPAEGAPLGIAEGRSEDGSRYLEVYSHPLEVVAMGRGDQPAPLTSEQLAKTLAADEAITGVLVDPRGPWIRLTRAELAPLLALAD